MNGVDKDFRATGEDEGGGAKVTLCATLLANHSAPAREAKTGRRSLGPGTREARPTSQDDNIKNIYSRYLYFAFYLYNFICSIQI